MVLSTAGSAIAGGFSFGGGKGGSGKSSSGKGGGFKATLGGGSRHKHHGHKQHGHHRGDHHKIYYKPYRPTYVAYDKCYHPYFSYCYVSPGDTWSTIAKRNYGTSNVWKHIAKYNGLRTSNTVLFAGQTLRLPVVNGNGTLAASRAPAPPAFQAPVTRTTAEAQRSMPQTSRDTSDSNLPSVNSGSTLALDGESFGGEQGAVRLRINGMALPVDVLEWQGNSVKIELPTLELAGAMKAELEVMRADGGLASKTTIRLMPAASGLALGN